MTARTTQAIRHLTAGFTEMGMAVSEQIYQATTAFARHDPDRRGRSSKQTGPSTKPSCAWRGAHCECLPCSNRRRPRFAR